MIPTLRLLLLPAALFALLLAPACGGSTDEETGAGPDTEVTAGDESEDEWEDDDWEDDDWDEETAAPISAREALEISGPETPWSEMSQYDRELYMAGKITPIMGELFVAHDGTRYADFHCETCHGEDAEENDYAMPPRRMYRIPAEGTAAYRSMLSTFGDTVTFMREEVTPTMGTLMGDPELSCSACHPTAD